MTGVGLDVTAIRRGLADTIRTTMEANPPSDPQWGGCRVYAFAPDLPELPAVIVYPGTSDRYIEYWGTFSEQGVGDLQLRLLIIAPSVVDWAGQEFIDHQLSFQAGRRSTVIESLMADGTLGGTVSDCKPLRARDLGKVSLNETDPNFKVYAAEIDLALWVTKG